jgi:hypothetical protein
MPNSFAEAFLLAMRYEHWLRFYFLADDSSTTDTTPMQSSPQKELAVGNADARIIVSQEKREISYKEEPYLFPILEAMTKYPVSMEHSRDIIFAWLGSTTGIQPGSSEFEAQMNAMTGDENFRRCMDGFHGWVQELANNELDLQGNALPPDAPQSDVIPTFAEWDKAFQFWFSLQHPFALNAIPKH